MDIQIFKEKLTEIRADALVMMIFEDEDRDMEILGRDRAETIKKCISHTEFRAKRGRSLRIPLPGDSLKNIYVVGLGERSKAGLDIYRTAVAEFVRGGRRDHLRSAVILLPMMPDRNVSSAVAEGVVLGNYSFDQYRTTKREDLFEMESVSLFGGNMDGLVRGGVFGSAQNLARDMANEPGNVVDPLVLAEMAREIAGEAGLESEILDEKQIQEEGMMALWHVGKGSRKPPRFIHLTYRPEGEPRSRIAIVGKGITFDSGGLSIKSGEHMRTMKGDKTGACNTLAVMRALAELQPEVEVHGIIGAAENMPGGNAYHPDDIVTARNGKTIEIVNTDAEGRVTLADSLAFASDLDPDAIIDMATLTGACAVALGSYTGGLFSNDDVLGDRILKAAERSGERLWRLPMDDEKLREELESPIADLLNLSGRFGGAITAAMFLESFVGKGIPWVHLDIAGVDTYEKEWGVYGKGASAFGVRTCLEYIMSL